MGAAIVLAALGLAALVGTALGGKPPSVRSENFPPSLNAGFVPTVLPKVDPSSISFFISNEIKAVDGSQPPALRKFVLETDRNARLDVTGLPVCGWRRVQSIDTAAVEAACRRAVVGTGTAVLLIAYPESTPIPVKTKLIVFNGGREGGVTTLHVRGFTLVPRPDALVATVKIRKIHNGRYGTIAMTRIPIISDGHGATTRFSLTIGREYAYNGKRRSVLSAKCADGKLLARGEAVFEDYPSAARTTVPASVIRVCTPK